MIGIRDVFLQCNLYMRLRTKYNIKKNNKNILYAIHEYEKGIIENS